ncbi:MAG TPA: HlyD family efflux transporter periplasmic adaptor subunit, partial [Gemmataceae bacterium]|nr:HlyD family efflux transporter periplasmic adaptor subunit [Gemmataceae bacterium]
DERTKQTKAAAAGCKAAKQAIKAAKSELLVTEAKLEKAHADLKVMETRIIAAEKDKMRTQAKAEWARIRAPFSGVITARNVDPGDFVQDATTARTKPMLTLMRLDLVTVVMMVPERAASFVDVDKPAYIQLEVQGKPIENLRVKVKRFAPILNPDKGRTMPAEVDIYNPPEHSYPLAVKKGVSSFLAPLGSSQALEAATLLAVGREKVWGRPGLLQPGMYGTMQLELQNFEDAWLIPSSAIFSRENKTYVYMVQGDVVRRVPVRVEYEDGIKAKVAMVVREGNAEIGEQDVLKKLEGNEKIIRIGQGELRDGQKVTAKPVQW